MEVLWAGITIGFFGSFHCVGMCSPIAMMMGTNITNSFAFFSSRFLYNIGRAFMYALLGALFGFIGTGVRLSGLQEIISVFAGIVILVVVFLPSSLRVRLEYIPPLQFLASWVKKTLSPLFTSSAPLKHFLVGLINGLLPCGFVYVGLAAALYVGTSVDGMTFMLGFGLGTFPAMFVVAYGSRMVSPALRGKLYGLMPYMTAVIGVMLILRGLSLDIPFVSPVLSAFPGGNECAIPSN
jgi:sulfite exporter TauE/SafE